MIARQRNPFDQKENKADIAITADIRKQVVNSNLSVNAQNVKIVTQDGKVTCADRLRRPRRKRRSSKSPAPLPGKAMSTTSWKSITSNNFINLQGNKIMSKSVFCTANPSQANTIVGNLKTAGFSNNDISVLMADKSGTKDFAHEHHTKAPEGVRPALERARRWAAPWAGSPESEHWRFPASVL